MTRPELPTIVWSGRPAGTPRTRAVVISLTGASAEDLARAIAHAEAFDAAPALIAVDGGLAACRVLRRTPALFVGDLDSARRAPAGVPSIVYAKAKAFSDFAGALLEARKRRARVVTIAGLMGGRLDHEWANLFEVGASARGFDGLIAASARGLILVTTRGVKVSGLGRRIVSAFAFRSGTRVTLRGTRWPLTRASLAPGSHGLSNVARGSVTLTVHAGVAALVVPGSEP
jgi:thiamine pyrophosphokinase